MRLLLYISALIAATISMVYLWRDGRFSTSDLIAVVAVIISIAIGAFTFLSRSLPPSVQVVSFNITLGGLPEMNRDWLVQEALWLDISQGLTKAGRDLAKLVKQQLKLEKIPDSREEFSKLAAKLKFKYDLTKEMSHYLIGKKPYSIPLIIGCSFINESPTQTLLEEVFLTIEDNETKFLYKPWFTVDDKKFYTRTFEKTRDFLSEPYHPFLLQGNSERAEHLFFVKDKSFDASGHVDDELELSPGEYNLKLYFKYSEHTRSVELPKLSLTEENLWELRGGGAVLHYQPTEFYKQLENTLKSK